MLQEQKFQNIIQFNTHHEILSSLILFSSSFNSCDLFKTLICVTENRKEAQYGSELYDITSYFTNNYDKERQNISTEFGVHE